MPTAVLSTSLGKYQMLCRIGNFTLEQQESNPQTAHDFLWRRSRLHGLQPGFRNCKNDPSYPITVKYVCDSTSNPGDFRLDIPAANALPLPDAIPSRKDPGKHTNSEHDWAWILHELAHGKDGAKLTRTIASRRSDNPVASARLCLNEGVPMEDVCHAAGGPPPIRDCLCAVYPKRPKLRMRWSRLRRSLQLGWSPLLLCGVEAMILHSIPRWCMDDASHRVNFDTPPLRGRCRALRGAEERPVQNE